MKSGDIVVVKFQPQFVNTHRMKVLEVFANGTFRAEHIPGNGHQYRFYPDQICTPPTTSPSTPATPAPLPS